MLAPLARPEAVSCRCPLPQVCAPLQARFDAGELITQRELVSRQVSEDLTERAATFGLILDDVSLVRVFPLPFPPLEGRESVGGRRVVGWTFGHLDGGVTALVLSL